MTSSAAPSTSSPPIWDRSVWGLMAILCGVLFLDGLDVSMVGMALPSIDSDLDLDHVAASVDRLRLRARLRRLSAPRGPGGRLPRTPARPPDRPRRLHGGVGARWRGQRRHPARHHPLPQGRVGGVHRARRALDHHDAIRGGPGATTAPSASTPQRAPVGSRSVWWPVGCSPQLGWRWTFLLPVPIAAVLLALAPRFLPRDRTALSERRSFDIPGAVTLTAGMLLLVRTVVEASEQGWGSAATVGGVRPRRRAAGGVRRDRATQRRSAGAARHPAPGSLVRANLGMAALFGAYVGFQFIFTLYLQAMNGWSPVETALAFLPAGLLVTFGSPRIGPLVDRFGTARLFAVGAFSSLAGYAARAAHRRRTRLRRGASADDAVDRAGLHAAVPGAQHPGDGRCG